MTTTTTGSRLAPVSEAMVRQYAAELVAKGTDARVLALAADPAWTGPDALEVAGQTVQVRGCVSALAVREALLGRPDDQWLVILTDRPAEDLGETLLARFRKQRVEPVDVWHTIPGLFAARELAPDLRGLGAVVAAVLVEYVPAGGYPPAPTSIVTRDHALRSLAATVLGLPPVGLDEEGLLTWTGDTAGRDRWRDISTEVRAALTTWAEQALGPVAAVALQVAASPGHIDAVTIGLAADVLWPAAGNPTPDALSARTRLEPFIGGHTLPEQVARRLAAAARGVLTRLGADGPARAGLLARAEALLADLKWPEGATASTVLPAGYDARLRTLAAAISARTGVEDAFAELLTHESARADRTSVTARAEMAVRLLRWLTRPDTTVSDVAVGLARQAGEDAWVDRAVADVWAGATLPELSAAYGALCAEVATRRAGHDQQLAILLAAATESELLPAACVPVEELLARVVVPLSGAAPVLLVVVDGMPTAVAAELTDGAQARGWLECLPEGAPGRLAALAALPTLTTYSRTSLLAGKLTVGTQVQEKKLFPAAVGGGPVFHKDDLRAGAGQALPAAVVSAVAGRDPVVAVVLNTVDDALAGTDPGSITWTLDAVAHLSGLLELADAHDRVVVLTSDHGHVLERGGTYLAYPGADARFRPLDSGLVQAGEVELRGRRVLSPGGAVIAAYVEDLRYGKKSAGYHGGAAAAEVTIPVVVLARDPSLLAGSGWVAAAPQAPRWWHEPEVQGAVPGPAAPRRAARPKQTEALFDVPTTSEPRQDLTEAVLSSSVYATQVSRAGRAAPEDELVRAVLSTLVTGDGRAHRDTVAVAARVPAARFPALLAVLRRILNVEMYEVISLDPDQVTVRLDLPLLREQFGIGP